MMRQRKSKLGSIDSAVNNDDLMLGKITHQKNGKKKKNQRRQHDRAREEEKSAVQNEQEEKKKKSDKKYYVWIPVVLFYSFTIVLTQYCYKRYGREFFVGRKRLDFDLRKWREIMGSEKTVVVCGGPHRGGTSMIWSAIGAYAAKISAFQAKVSDHSEGIFAQDVYPKFGIGQEWMQYRNGGKGVSFEKRGLGKYALDEDNHLDLTNALNTDENAVKLMNAFGSYWDLEKSYFLEKSPSNAIIGTFLRALFARVGAKTTKHIYITRHPIANAMALNNMAELKGTVNIRTLMDNYIKLHETAQRDAKLIGDTDALYVVRMEDFAEDPETKLREIFKFIFSTANEIDDETNNNKSSSPSMPEKDSDEEKELFSQCIKKLEQDTGRKLNNAPNEKYRKQWCAMISDEKSTEAKSMADAIASEYQKKIDDLGLGYSIATWCD